MSETDKLPEILPCARCGAVRGHWPYQHHIGRWCDGVWDGDHGVRCGRCQVHESTATEASAAIHRWNAAFLKSIEFRPALVIRYRNWRGKAGIRRIVPLRTEHRAEPPYHPEPAWLLDAWDCDKRAVRSFVMTGILEVLREEARDE